MTRLDTPLLATWITRQISYFLSMSNEASFIHFNETLNVTLAEVLIVFEQETAAALSVTVNLVPR